MGIYNYLLPHVTINPGSVKFNILPKCFGGKIGVLKLFLGKIENTKGRYIKHIYLLHKKTMQSKQIMIKNYIFPIQTYA